MTIPKKREISGIERRYGQPLACDLPEAPDDRVRPPLPRRLPELLVASLEARPVGKVDGPARQVNLLAVDLLQPNDEHRTIRFGEDGRANLDDVVRPDGEEEAIECGVVELAQGDAVADHRLALGVAIGRDVGRVQQLLVAQPAEGAALGVRAEHPLTQG